MEISEETIEMLTQVGVVAGGIVGLVLFSLFVIKQFLIIGRPNELLIFSGRTRRLENGDSVGWRTVRGGRSFRVPLIERVDRMDLTTMAIDIRIRGAYSKGNIQVNVDAVANAKIASDDSSERQAIERFLGTSQDELKNIAKETLEGTLRDVIATMTPEELNHNRQKLSEKLMIEVEDDLKKFGLMVDTFRIQHVADDKNYLDSISRMRIAEVLRDAEIAESDADREAEQVIAEALSRGRVAKEKAETEIAEKENELKRIRAELDGTAKAEEERTIAAAREARATAEQQLQTIRRELEQLRLQAEQVIPAEMKSRASELKAAGDAAIKEETGRAESEALNALYAAWVEAGVHAKEVFLVQQIDRILEDVAQVTQDLTVDNVNIIDSGDGRGLAEYVGSYPAIVTQILERIRETVGVDIVDILAPTKEPAQQSKRLGGKS